MNNYHHLISLLSSPFLSHKHRYASLHLFNDEVTELLQEDHHALWSAVVLGMAPDETQSVEERRQQSVYLRETPLF